MHQSCTDDDRHRARRGAARPGWLSSLWRSVVVGGAATLVDLALLWLGVSSLGVSPAAANVPALLGGVLVQFFGNKYFIFAEHSADYVRQGLLFSAVEIVALALNALLFHVLVASTSIPYPLARLLGSAAVYFCFSFPLWRLIFRPRLARARGAA